MMKFILFACLCTLAFSKSLEKENEELLRTNQLLQKTLRELEVGLETEVEVKNQNENAVGGTIYRSGNRQGTIYRGRQTGTIYRRGGRPTGTIYRSGNRPTGTIYRSGNRQGRIYSTGNQQEEEVAGYIGCYNSCRSNGGDEEECKIQCPVPGEEEVGILDSAGISSFGIKVRGAPCMEQCAKECQEEEVGIIDGAGITSFGMKVRGAPCMKKCETQCQEWKCYRYWYPGEDDEWCQSIGGPFVFTRGNNDNYPGCGTCWCCKRKAGRKLWN